MENGKSGKKRGRKKKNIVPIDFEKIDSVVKINNESLKKDYDNNDIPNKSGKNVQSTNLSFGGLNIKRVSVKHNNTDEPKTMYFELIKMLMDYERIHCKSEAYNQVKDVGKIQGYQELTNRLLRNINEKLVKDLESVSNKLDRLEQIMGLSSDEKTLVINTDNKIPVGKYLV